MLHRSFPVAPLLLGLLVSPPAVLAELKAGAAIVDVTPVQLPVFVNGNMRSKSIDVISTRVNARAIVLDDGQERLAIVVVDSCMMSRPFLDEAKLLASQRTKIKPDRMMISATHTHSAPASMGCLGTDADPTYVPYLREKLAEAIAAAEANLEPARVGWAVENAAAFTALRRWIIRPDRIRNDPFGNPLSFTQQWIDSLLGTPGADVDGLNSLNFARVAEPFSWYGDSVFFPGGFAGYAWLTHRLINNPAFGADYCALPGFPPGQPAPPPFNTADQVTCETGGFLWTSPPEFITAPQFFPPRPGRGDEAVPAYDPNGFPFPNVANLQAIQNMPTALGGAFKVPNLRNVSLTGPFFHNGGQATLRQVVEFYNRGGDFAIENLGDLAPNINPLGLNDQQIDDIVAFLEALTDERVRCERAPFDHPEITLPEGHRQKRRNRLRNDGSGQGIDRSTVIRQVGANGKRQRRCLQPFMESNDDDSDSR